MTTWASASGTATLATALCAACNDPSGLFQAGYWIEDPGRPMLRCQKCHTVQSFPAAPKPAP